MKKANVFRVLALAAFLLAGVWAVGRKHPSREAGSGAAVEGGDQPADAGVDAAPEIALNVDPAEVPVLVFPAPGRAALMAAAETLEAKKGIHRFAERLVADVTPSRFGKWTREADGLLRWTLRVGSPGADHLNFGFKEFRMPNGGRLRITEAGREPRIRDFTVADNEAHGELWTPLFDGDEALLEVTVPEVLRPELRLRLTAVNHGFRGWKSKEKPDGKIGGDRSGSCNIDVACSAGDGVFGPLVDAHREQIRAVGAYTVGGVDTCSGALINNTALDRRPFFLTADHCGVGPGNAASVVVYWNFENSTCRTPGSAGSGGVGDGNLSQFNSGALFRANFATSDFCLLELDDPALPEANLFFAGWNRSAANATMATGIHHPAVAEKRISFELDATETTAYSDTDVPGDGSHVRVPDWDFGTTEGGSSGSPLFDQDGRIIGQLHGGGAACGNDDSDWYGRLFVSWVGGGTASNRLSDWLDPLATGVAFLDGTSQDELLSAEGGSVVEGHSGQIPLVFTVRLSSPSMDTVSVTARTQNDTAEASTDFVALAPTVLTFAPGETEKTVEVLVLGDSAPEENERFRLVLSAPVNAAVNALAPGLATILNDDFIAPQITSGATASGFRSQAFAYQITALNTPTTFAVEGAPEGMVVDSLTGQVSWTPTVAGTVTFTVVAGNPAGEGRLLVTLTVGANPLADAVELAGDLSLSSASPAWFRQTGVFRIGGDAAQSGVVGDGALSTMELRVTGPDAVAFWWRVSSEEGFDSLELLLDGQRLDAISGERDWARKVVSVPGGAHTLRWQYEKDGSVSEGNDAAWVDEVVVASTLPGPTIVSPLTLVAEADAPFSYQTEVINGPATFSFSALPAGLSHAGGGLLTGSVAAPGNYAVTITADNGSGQDVRTVAIEIIPAIGPSLGAPYLPWSVAGAVPWSPQTAVSYDGGSAARSGGIGDGQRSELRTAVQGPDTIVFRWKVSSEANFDFLTFELDGQAQFSISGERDWEQQVFKIPGGSHTLSWVYEKDSSFSDGADAGYLDAVTLASRTSVPLITNAVTARGFAGRPFALQVTTIGVAQGFAATGLPVGIGIDAASGLISGLPEQAGTYPVTLTATGEGGTGALEITLTVVAEIPLGAALDAPAGLRFYGQGTTAWLSQTTTTHDGVDAGASALVGNNGMSRLDTFVAGPGSVSFWWRVSSEQDYDFLRLLVDGAEAAALSGDSGWISRTLSLAPGEHQLTWIYSKDGSQSTGADRGFLDELTLGGYASWVAASGLASHRGGFLDDGDNDGIVTLAEYGLDLNPALSDARLLPVVVSREGGFLTLTLTKGTTDPAVRFSIEGAASLAGPWSVDNAPIEEQSPNLLKARYAQPLDSGQMGYLRARIGYVE